MKLKRSTVRRIVRWADWAATVAKLIAALLSLAG